MRAKILHSSVIILFVLIGLAVFNLCIIKGNKFRQLSDKNCIRFLSQVGCRGKILDRNNKVIVDSYLTYDVMVFFQDKSQIEKTLSGLSRILGVDSHELKRRFKSSYVASFLPVCIEKNVDIKKAIALEESKLDLPGVLVQPHPLRHYPYGSLASHVIGYLNQIDRSRLGRLSDYGYSAGDVVGFGGVEEKYDYFLRESDGAFSVEVDHKGKLVRILGYRPPQSGKDIQLALSLDVQEIIEDALHGRKGSVIIMDPYTGEIIAMASAPGFNPAVFINKSSSQISRLFTDSDAPLVNRAISGVYPPGSVFKIIMASAGLETKKINTHTSFFCPGAIHVGKREFKCWDTHNQQDLTAALAHSCDVFFYRTGLLLGGDAIHDYAIKFGLSKPTSVDLPYEKNGFVPSPLWKRIYRMQNWYDGDTANFSIGQGDLMTTPLQITRVTAVFANGGFLVTPHVIKNIQDYEIPAYNRKPAKAGIQPNTLNAVRSGMRAVAADPQGTAGILSGIGIPIAGKTGTVQVSQGQPHAWFTGYLPYDKPKYVMTVFLEHGGSGYASVVLAKQIVERMIDKKLIE